MRQPPKKKKPATPAIDPEFLALATKPAVQPPQESVDPEFLAMAQAPVAQKAPSSLGGMAKKAGETVADIMAAGLSNIPGAPTMYGALSATGLFGPKKTIKEGAQEFQDVVRQAQERSPVLANPLSPAAVAGSMAPYLLPFGQGTRLTRALYSGAVGGARSGERAAVAGEAPVDIAKKAAVGGGMESAMGALLGEPAGAIARSYRTPSRVTQVLEQKAKTRAAEKPLYDAWTGYATKGGPVTSAPLSPPTQKLAEAIENPIVRQAFNVVRKNPNFADLPITSPVVLDRIYKVTGSKAFKDKYTVAAEAAEGARDLLKAGMVESRPDLPYTDVLRVASGGRKIGEAIERAAEVARVASSGAPPTLSTATKKGVESFAEYIKTATPEQRAAASDAIFGYLREAPKTARIGTMRGSIPVPFLPSRAAMQAPRLSEMTGVGPTMLQRGVRGGVAASPSAIQTVLNRFLGYE